LAPYFINRKFNFYGVFLTYAAASAAVLAAIFGLQVFPACYIDGVGLTKFKVASEYIVCLLTAGEMWRLSHRQQQIRRSLYLMIMATMVCTILSELSFTLYRDVYGIMNFTGHILKIFRLSFCLPGDCHQWP
jgi:hypothetical protein